ncbi:hypothetical protein OR16_27497 [Cupriavidus basilensis OR16]|uniref:Uncharacterized protein n=1 Tax=Cupriavidus basilensis OR16 TaxID=1127483 RepID=H1SBE6_9BURK|nr:hypothetical protein OR16_27497 [Cupriavidus basilensis OR16]
MARGENLVVFAGVTLRRAHIADAAVPMLVVVPVDEIRRPGARRGQIGEVRISGRVIGDFSAT